MSKILTISDRFHAGGAAIVARKIFQHIEKSDSFEGIFLYGLDKRGFPNKSYPDTITTASYYFGPHLNLVACRLMGKNIIPSKKGKLLELVRWADVIHVHNIHTYGFEYKQLFTILGSTKKKVILTAHDDWFYTGRCAIRQECEGWKTGCKKCPNLSYYHPTVFDNAKKEFVRKTTLIKSLPNCVLVAPTNHISKALSHVYPNIQNVVISNGIDISAFTPPLNESKTKEIQVLIISNNYEDQIKLDHRFIKAIISANVSLHLVGPNSMYKGSNITNYGFIKNQKDLSNIMQECDVLLFFSKVDSFGLVLAECLCTGMFICAYDSRAAQEVLDGFNRNIISENPIEFINKLSDPSFVQECKNLSKRKKQAIKAREKFDQNTMIKKYCELYV